MRKHPTKAKGGATMAPTPTTKRLKVSANKGVRKTKGGAGRRRTQSDSDDDDGPVVTPMKWSTTNTTRNKQTRSGSTTQGTRASATTNDDDSENASDSEDDEEDLVEAVGRVTKNSGSNLTTAALGNQIQLNTKDTIETLQESVAKLEARNQMLARQIKNITSMGGVDKYALTQIRKMVKEDLFKRVKFITTTAMEAKCMQYLSNNLNVPTETKRDWSFTYAHCVRDALNNKRNNVCQDLKSEIKGKQNSRDREGIRTNVDNMN